ncbi:MAG: YdcF family protein [Thermodesulfobacteriota bacterium]
MDRFDVIIVLGAAVWEGHRPSPALRRRLLHGVSLWKQGAAEYLLVTGGLGQYPPAEARIMKALATEEGVPPEKVLSEDQSASTFESGIRCAKIMRDRGWSRALLVTDGYHLARSLLVFRSRGIAAEGSAADRGGKKRASRHRWFSMAREIIAYLWYRIRITAEKLSERV